ncbi:MAG: zf-HC2 domain-containing protein [Ktedonobacterales bacterium]
MSTETQHEWLRRVSDYHSGDVDAAEAASVEEHLAGCEECRRALAVYQRFYALASSPLRLGELSSVVAEQLSMTNDGVGRFMDGATVERHSRRHGSLHPEQSRRLLGIASVLAASLIIVGFLAVLGPRIGSIGKPTTPTPYPSATLSGPTPTVQLNNLPAPGTGYTNAGPDWATNLAFAPSSPNIVYACGEVPYVSIEILVAISTDGGHSWQSQASPASPDSAGILPRQGYSLGPLNPCTLTVDPTNPWDVALLAQYCTDYVTSDNGMIQCEAMSTQLYRSFDAGATWAEVGKSDGDWIASEIASEIAWVGSTLFISTTEGIARSIAGGPFTLLRQSFFGTTTDADLARNLSVIGNTLFVSEVACQAAAGGSPCAGPTERSDDLGVRWSPMSWTYRSNIVSLLVVGGDGKTLIGRTLIGGQSDIFLRSVDGGATWSPLPPAPNYTGPFSSPSQSPTADFSGLFETDGLSSECPITESPDGTIYTELSLNVMSSSGIGTENTGIYELALGAENWRYFAPPPGGYVPEIFLWSSAGHLAVIWGERGSRSDSGFQYLPF